MRNRRIVGSYAFRCLGFDSHLVRLELEQFGNTLLNLLCMGADLRFRQDQSGIDIGDLVSGALNLPERFGDEYGRVSAFPLGIGRREIAADVACSNSTEKRVGDGVK